jgi:hypothetical protein
MIDYMAGKRDKVNSYLDVSSLDIKSLPENELDNFLVNFSFAVEPEKLPPIEYIIMKLVEKPQPIVKVINSVKAPSELVKGAIIALQVKGMLFIKDNNIEMNWRKQDLFEKGLIKPFWPL